MYSYKRMAALVVLWKYTCPVAGKDFYLSERMTTVRSPFTGKSFTTHPEKMTPSQVVKDIQDEFGGSDSVFDTYLDKRTGLEWQLEPSNNPMTYSEALSYARSLGTGWRLPTAVEAEYIIKTNLFADDDYYCWTTTAYTPAMMTVVDFNNSLDNDALPPRHKCKARCVRKV